MHKKREEKYEDWRSFVVDDCSNIVHENEAKREKERKKVKKKNEKIIIINTIFHFIHSLVRYLHNLRDFFPSTSSPSSSSSSLFFSSVWIFCFKIFIRLPFVYVSVRKTKKNVWMYAKGIKRRRRRTKANKNMLTKKRCS